MAILEELLLRLEADVKGYRKDLAAATKTTDKTTKKMGKDFKELEKVTKKSSKSVSTAVATMAGVVGGQLVFAAMAALKNAVFDAGREMLSFSKATAEVNTILPKNAKLTEKTKKELIKFSSQFGGAPTRQAKAFYQIVSAGITDTVEATNLLAIANKTAVAGVTDVQTAIEGLTGAMAVYGNEGLTATQASDILFAAVREGKTTIAALSTNLGKVTSISKAAGVSFNETAASIAFLTKSGISTEIAVTGLRSTIASIIKPTKEASDAAKRLGINFSVAGIKQAGGFAKFMELVREKTGGSIENIKQLFTNLESLPVVLNILKGDFNDFSRIQGMVADSTGDAAAALEEMKKSSDFQLTTLVQSLKNIGVQAGILFEADLAGGFKDLKELIPGLLTGLSTLVKGLDLVVRAVQTFQGVKQIGAVVRKSILIPVTAAVVGVDDAIDGVLETMDDAEKNITAFGDSGDGALSKISETLDELAANSKKSMEEAGASTEAFIGPLQLTLKEELALLEQQRVAAEERTVLTEEERARRILLAEEGAVLADNEILAMQETSEIRGQILTDRFNKELKKLIAARDLNKITDKKFDLAALALTKKFVKDKEAVEKAHIKTMENLRNKTMLARASLAQNTANLIVAITGKESKAAFLLAKSAGIARSIVATNVAAASALMVPPAPNLALSATAKLAGRINTATIIATGIKGLQHGTSSVPGFGAVDSVPAMLTPRERVITVDENKDLTEFLRRQNQIQTQSPGGEIRITMSDRAAEMVRAEFIEEDALGISEAG